MKNSYTSKTSEEEEWHCLTPAASQCPRPGSGACPVLVVGVVVVGGLP